MPSPSPSLGITTISPSAGRLDEPARGAVGKPAAAVGNFGSLPVTFIENQGQADRRVRYYAQGPRYAFYLTRDELLLSFLDQPATSGVALALRFPGSNPARTIVGEDRAAGDINYFQGSDQTAWRTAIPHYRQVTYRNLWPGVDLSLREQRGTLKYEFRVQPHARPADVRLAYKGATHLSLDADGSLLVGTPMGVLRDAPPAACQTIDGVQVPVESRYVVNQKHRGDAEYGFVLGAGYRADRELIIDPGVEFTTFLGGSSDEQVGGIRVDAPGNTYIAGTTQSPDFPTAPDRSGGRGRPATSATSSSPS